MYPGYIKDLILKMKHEHFVIHEEYDAEYFGNVIVTSIYEGFVIRIISDRNQWLVDIKNPQKKYDWINIKYIYQYIEHNCNYHDNSQLLTEWLTIKLDEIMKLFSCQNFIDHLQYFIKHKNLT